MKSRYVPWAVVATFLVTTVAMTLIMPGFSRAHTFNSGAIIVGNILAQPDSACLNGDTARVMAGIMTITPKHDSWFTGTEVVFYGNGNAVAIVVDTQESDGSSVKTKRLTGEQQSWKLYHWFHRVKINIPGNTSSVFILYIDYKRNGGNTVQKVTVEERLKQTVVVSSDHGGQQKINLVVYFAPDTSGNTIPLKEQEDPSCS